MESTLLPANCSPKIPSSEELVNHMIEDAICSYSNNGGSFVTPADDSGNWDMIKGMAEDIVKPRPDQREAFPWKRRHLATILPEFSDIYETTVNDTLQEKASEILKKSQNIELVLSELRRKEHEMDQLKTSLFNMRHRLEQQHQSLVQREQVVDADEQRIAMIRLASAPISFDTFNRIYTAGVIDCRRYRAGMPYPSADRAWAEFQRTLEEHCPQ